jgi:hypothetical protein
VVRELDRRRIGCLTLLEPNEQDLEKGVAIERVAKTFRPMTTVPLIANTGFDKAKGMDLLRMGMPTPSRMVDSISPILIWSPASNRTRRSASPIPLRSMARVPMAIPTIRSCQPCPNDGVSAVSRGARPAKRLLDS